MIGFKKLVEARVHFGHKTDRWFPGMEPYIWGKKNKVHLIDVSKTAFQMEKSAKFLESVAEQGKQILWVGTKRPAQDIIVETGKKLKMPYVNHRWVGGTITNHSQVKRSVTKMVHFEDVLAKSEKFPYYTKKELSEMRKNLERLQTSVDGIRNLKFPIGALVVVDVSKEITAIKEASRMGIPIVALVDTNGDPSLIDYVIPGNDDSPRSIEVVIDYLAEAVARGKEAAKEQQAQVAEKEPKSKEGKPSDDTQRAAKPVVKKVVKEEAKENSEPKESAKKVIEVHSKSAESKSAPDDNKKHSKSEK